MELLGKIVNEHSIIAFGLTVLKSLWIGAMVSGLAAVLFSFTRKSAKARYIIACISMATILISTVIVFISTNNSYHRAYGNSTMISGVTAVQTADEYLHPDKLSEGVRVRALAQELSAGAERMFIHHSEWIVLIWLIGVIFHGVKFTGGYIYSRKYSKRISTDIPVIWAARIETIAEKINLGTKISTVKSYWAKVPMVTGWIKPVLILPASLLAGIPADQLEAIIAHELAHIKRNDYLVNIIQSLAEVLMFYNPAIWWLSQTMKRERENCCDDIALEAGTESMVYIKALANMQAISLTPPAPAVAIKRNNNHLINRIKRITSMKKNNNILNGKLIALPGIVLTLSALLALTGFITKTDSLSGQPAENNIRVSKPGKGESISGYPGSLILTQDTLRKEEASSIRTTWTDPADNKEKEVDMRIRGGQLIELKIDGEIIPEEDYPVYQDLIDDTMADYEKAMKELEDLDMEEIERDVEEAMKELQDLDMEEIERDVEEAMKELEDLDMEEIERDVEEAMKELQDLDMEEIERDIREAMLEVEKVDMEELKIKIDSLRNKGARLKR